MFLIRNKQQYTTSSIEECTTDEDTTTSATTEPTTSNTKSEARESPAKEESSESKSKVILYRIINISSVGFRTFESLIYNPFIYPVIFRFDY